MSEGPGTRAVHAGDSDDLTGAISPPLVMAVNYRQDEPGVPRAEYVYARTNNPTRQLLEQALARVEGSAHAVTFASGMAALDAVVRATCRPGDHVLLPSDTFSGTVRLFGDLLDGWGISTTVTDLAHAEDVERHIRPSTRLIVAESPSNPLLHLVDVPALAQVATRHGALLVMDNTFGTPFSQRLLDLGADLSVSSNKLFSGHADAMVGIVTLNDDALAERLRFIQNAAGAIPSPWDCWLTLRGVKTLPLRLARQSDTALQIATWLVDHPAVASVHYPGLPDDPGHSLAAAQMSFFGPVISFTMRSGPAGARAVCVRTNLFTLAESVGSTESLIQLPARMTHDLRNGRRLLTADLVRLSIGLEDADDLILDLDKALAASAS